MATIRTSSNPTMLSWARNEIGYSVEEAAEAIGISKETLEAAEAGDHKLTLVQLRKVAEVFDTPFGYFYLTEIPHENSYKPVPDFRIDPDLIGVSHHRLHLEIKKVRARREIFLDLANDLGRNVAPFRLVHGKDPITTARIARDRLGVTDASIASLAIEQVYSFWKARIEADGVLVYESQYIPPTSGVIGIAIYYQTYPIILIRRGADVNARKLFTLLHEYAHILLGESAVNDSRAQFVQIDNSDQARLETFCNRVAAETLVPSTKIRLDEYSGLTPVEKMERLSDIFKVTYTTAAVCLKRMRIINDQEFANLLRLRKEAHKKKKQKDGREVRIPRETLMRLDLGRPMFDAVLSAYAQGRLDVFDAAKILSLRVNKIDRLMAGT